MSTNRKRQGNERFNLQFFLNRMGSGRKIQEYKKKAVIFAQGESAGNVCYIRSGRVRLSVVSKEGKEATISLLGPDEFFGEGCIADQVVRMATATAVTDCSILVIEKEALQNLLHKERRLADLFLGHMLTRNIRIEEDLIDQLFNSSERRLARILLLLARYGTKGSPDVDIPRISQETLAGMVGTTRSRVSFFMNKFRKLGFIRYNGGIQVHRSLLSVVLHE